MNAKFWSRRSREERALLTILRGVGATLDDATVECCDWEKVFTTAVRHQVGPLIGDRLGPLTQRLPTEVRARFDHEIVRNMGAKAAMAKKLEEVLDWLAELGVDAMLIKGTSLERRISPAWLTVSGDVDLMLRGDLSALGPAVFARVRELNAGTPVVDLHGTPHPDLAMNGVLPIDFDAIWRRAEPIDVGGRRAWRMSLADELVAACVQSCRKRFFRLKSVFEIDALLRDPGLDLDAALDRSRRWRCAGPVYGAIRAANATLDTAAPTELRRRLGLSRPRAAALRFLIARGALEDLYDGVTVRGKFIGKGLMLPYATLGWGQLWNSARVVRGQMKAPNAAKASLR